MAMFFNGRSWVSPAVMSVVDDSKMYNRGLSAGNNLALIGTADGGEPNTVLVFGSASEARSLLRDGNLLRGVERAFNASSQSPGPAKIYAVRLGKVGDANPSNNCTQASLILKDSLGSDAIYLKSTNFGLVDNQIKVKIEAGTNVGLKLSTKFGGSEQYADNVARNAFSIQYTGTGAGVMTVGNAELTLTLNSVSTAISLATYPTVQSLVDRLNAVTGIDASVLDGSDEKPALNGLDGVTSQDIKAISYTVTATLQAAINWFNSQGESFVTATRPATATKVPAPIDYAYLSGGSNGLVTNTEWGTGLEALETADVQWVVPLSGLDSIHAMVSAHVSYMSDVARKERRAICGTTSATSDANAIAAAKNLNSDRVSLTHLGIYDYDANGALTMFEPFIAAAMIAASFAGLNPGTPMTNKALKISGLERKLRNPTDTDDLITGGVLCLEDTPNGYKVVQSISTWLLNDNYNRREVSVGAALDFVMRNVRNSLEDIKGKKNDPLTLGLALSRVDTVLRELSRPEPSGPGVLAGDKENPPYLNLSAYQEGDVLRVEFQCSPVLPVNYIPVVCYAKPYSGSSSTLTV